MVASTDNTPGWLQALNSLGTTASNIVGNVRGNTASNTTRAGNTAAAQNKWLPVILIGGAVALVLVLVLALRKK